MSMLFLVVGASVYLASEIAENINRLATKSCKKALWIIKVGGLFLIILSLLFMILGLNSKYSIVEQWEIPIHNLQDFKVIQTEDYFEWNDGYGEFYIVPKSKVEMVDSDSIRVYKIVKSTYTKKEASPLIDFGIFAGDYTVATSTSDGYKIECPESCVIISQKSNREIKVETPNT